MLYKMPRRSCRPPRARTIVLSKAEHRLVGRHQAVLEKNETTVRAMCKDEPGDRRQPHGSHRCYVGDFGRQRCLMIVGLGCQSRCFVVDEPEQETLSSSLLDFSDFGPCVLAGTRRSFSFHNEKLKVECNRHSLECQEPLIAPALCKSGLVRRFVRGSCAGLTN